MTSQQRPPHNAGESAIIDELVDRLVATHAPGLLGREVEARALLDGVRMRVRDATGESERVGKWTLLR